MRNLHTPLLIREGFWYWGMEPHLPMVVEGQPFSGQDVVVAQLRTLQGRLDAMRVVALEAYKAAYAEWGATTSREDRIKRVGEPQYPEGTDKAPVVSYKGYSTCRICGILNGYQSYIEGGYIWPSGYLHYIEAHNVEPSVGFRAMLATAFSQGEQRG